MSEQEKKLDGPDFAQGVPFGDLAEGSMIVGHVLGEAVVLARTGGALFAIGGGHMENPARDSEAPPCDDVGRITR